MPKTTYLVASYGQYVVCHTAKSARELRAFLIRLDIPPQDITTTRCRRTKSGVRIVINWS